MKKAKPSQITFRLTDDLRSELERIAKGEERSLSKQVVFALKHFVKDYKIKGETVFEDKSI
jgi:predicted transcriptional regulator